ncbi:uncharacterized protein EHS24_008227 [Apiotrichum porosum]|uniref:Uncharacterized protein n=1 Tax=Apiotrichum porosum TaxID=105984 RepID=A0A427XT83_9TREE|nr:uncharacterized protein EHS24_008227 [Apiotrichum porosum]RSH82023.1 hypothetical protein EHS24_008227 [Apiotrichum porosum]
MNVQGGYQFVSYPDGRARGFYVPGVPISGPPRYSDSSADINRFPPAEIRVDTRQRAICHACSNPIASPTARGYCENCIGMIRQGQIGRRAGGQTSYAHPSTATSQAAWRAKTWGESVRGFWRRMFCV